MTETPTNSQAQELIRRAYLALRDNDRSQARQFASQAARLDPGLEDPWLILAALAGPQAAEQYLKRALQINPNSERARKGLEWTLQRAQQRPPAPEPAPVVQPETNSSAPSAESPASEGGANLARTAPVHLKPASTPVPTTPIAPHPVVKPARRRWITAAAGLMVLLCLVGAAWFVWPMISSVFAQAPNAPRPEGVLQKPSLTPTFTETPTPTFTATPTFTPTATFTATFTATVTPSATTVPTNTRVAPTKTRPAATKAASSSGQVPSNIQSDQRWVDVDLSEQKAYAYQGSQVIRSFVVSTGISSYPTVTGQYHIYVKYRYADMAGVGWYLPKVPYVMYFYKGYGLHGTYWHNNFGHPMSHGCINFKTEDAAWLFDFASVGTLVNIHN